jgi:transcriptional regulator with XRE-family HTH domain
MHRRELADFLRHRRALVQPADVGLEDGRRRRTPGLRREEVARLAAISTDYYTRLEQARGPRPSCAVLHGLARALRLSTSERAYFFGLVQMDAGPRPGPPQDVPPGILHLLDRLDDTPAYVLDAKWDFLAWNPMAAALMGDRSGRPPRGRNVLRWLFLPATGPGDLDADLERIGREGVADLRAAATRYPDDPGVHGLIAELQAASPLFASLWDAHDVRVARSNHKRTDHPLVGPLEVDSHILVDAEHDMRVVIYTAQPGTPSHEALQLLRMLAAEPKEPQELREPAPPAAAPVAL